MVPFSHLFIKHSLSLNIGPVIQFSFSRALICRNMSVEGITPGCNEYVLMAGYFLARALAWRTFANLESEYAWADAMGPRDHLSC